MHHVIRYYKLTINIIIIIILSSCLKVSLYFSMHTHTHTLCVAAFPEWLEHINSTERDISSDYTMSCVASGKPRPHVRWLKNGHLVSSTQ